MSTNILQMLMSAITPAIVGKLSGMLGESSEATQKGLAGALPTLLGAMIAKGGNAQGAEGLIGMISKANLDGGMLDKLDDLLGGGAATTQMAESGGAIAQQLLGDKAGGIGALLEQFAGLKSASIPTLLGLAAPLVMGGLMKQAPAGGFSPAGLMGLLGGQKEHLARMLPPGLAPLGGMLGLDLTPPPPAYTPSSPPAAPAPAPVLHSEPGSPRNLLLMLGLLALALLGALFGPSMCSQRTAQSGTPVVEAPAPGTLALPGGETITVPPGSIGEQLFTYLSSTEAAPRTFTFDNLNFQSGGSTLTAESGATVSAITAILRAFPNARVTLDGYTDNTGGLGANQRISQARAQTVATMMTDAGIGADRISATGHGPADPVADNATEEGRARNRRIELTVTAK
jgi:outer membrane protein OmpA-like peptidoglycan-associated protein